MGRPLGDVQKNVLQSLKEHRGWYAGCGWLWDNLSNATRILESLVRRGLVKRTSMGGSHMLKHRYDITPEGDKLL